MNRRNFLSKAAIATGAVSLTGPLLMANSANNTVPKQEFVYKITVVDKGHNKAMFQAVEKRDGAACEVFELNQEFILENFWAVPEGFCQWAWADIRPFIQQVYFGREVAAGCCTDGKRPVTFKIERIKK